MVICFKSLQLLRIKHRIRKMTKISYITLLLVVKWRLICIENLFSKNLLKIMELKDDFIGIQGVLVSCHKKIGDFTRINYRGGNEENILYILEELSKFLTSKGFLQENKVDESFKTELNEIAFFLALNTVFKKQVLLDNCAHLTLIVPQLSKCLLANICFGLELCEQYGFVIDKMPLDVTEELLDPAIECLKKSNPKDHLHNAFILLRAVEIKLSTVEFNNKSDELIEDIALATDVILQSLTGLYSDQTKNMNVMDIYVHMGYTLLNLFDLLLQVEDDVLLRHGLRKFLEFVLATSCAVVRSITIKVFCAWVEVTYDDQPLQTIVAGKAYQIIEKYQKHKMASELISMLSTIARKPKSLTDLIQEADIPTIIKKVHEKTLDQKNWFQAMLNTKVFENPQIVECLSTWWHLCNESDVDRLLSLPLPSGSSEKQLIVKCASTLNFQDLLHVLTIYFHREKFVWHEDTEEQLIFTFNQINDSEYNESDSKSILLLLLQNARLFFHHCYSGALKSSSDIYRQIFSLISIIAEIDSIGLDTLLQFIEENKPNSQNLGSYIKFFEMLLSCKYISWDYMVSNVFVRLIDKYRQKEECLENLSCCLQIFKQFDSLSCELTREIEVFEFLLICASDHRCKSYLEFTPLKEEVTRCCVDYILAKCEVLGNCEEKRKKCSLTGENIEDAWSNYYKNLFLGNKDVNIIDYLLPNFDLENYKSGKPDENFTRLLKVLPRCVSTEWRILLKDIEDRCQFAVTLNALTDIMILLCDITDSQRKSQGEGPNKLIISLRFCLQNFGRLLELDSKSREDQILAINNVCRILRHIPPQLKANEGMSFINVLPEDALRSLAQDKEFIARIVLINDKQICKILAQKILGNV